MQNKVKINICGQEYTLVSEENQEYMLRIAETVDKKITEIKSQNATLNTPMAAILAALNLADDLEKVKVVAREKVDAQAAEITSLKKQLEDLSRKIPSHGKKH